MNTIKLHYNKRPSALANLARAFGTFGRGRNGEPPRICVTRATVPPAPEHIQSFHEICETADRDELHLLYPLTHAYPLLMRLLSHRRMPFSMTQVLNTRTVITQTRGIAPTESFSLECVNGPWRAAHKGLELDVTVDLKTGEETCWTSVVTYLIRGAKGAEASLPVTPPRFAPLAEAAVLAQWTLEPKHRVRFAWHCGDSNGIHMAGWYARLFGFERDFAQPIRVVARCVDALPLADLPWPRRLEFHLKGPVYYGRTLSLSGAPDGDQHRFELHINDEPRPCILGAICEAPPR